MIDSYSNLFDQQDVFVSVITGNDNFHPALSYMVALYVSILSTNTSFIIPIDHPEKISEVDLNNLKDELYKANNLYCVDKKTLLYYIPLNKVKDLKFSLGNIEYESNRYIDWVYSRNKNYEDVNKIIPLLKHQEKFDNLLHSIKDRILNIKWEDGDEFFNSTAAPVFNLIERHGLKVIYKPFIDLFKPNYPDFNMKDNVVYTFYNLYNITSRPTNAFNSINFLAIPKKLEYRRCIVPQFDTFVEFDFDGYHLRLIAEQVGYDLTEEPAHRQIGRLLLGVEELTQEQYTQVKQINFQALYGNTPDEYKNFRFFKLVEEWTHKLWTEFNSKGYVYSPFSNKKFDTTLDGIYPKKLLNYMIQSMETGRNIITLKNTLNYLKDKKTKIALYTYDSVLFDFSIQDGKQTLQDIENILSEEGKYPVKFKYSKDLVFD